MVKNHNLFHIDLFITFQTEFLRISILYYSNILKFVKMKHIQISVNIELYFYYLSYEM